MDVFFEELLERAHYYERFDFVNKNGKTRIVSKKGNEARMEEIIIEC